MKKLKNEQRKGFNFLLSYYDVYKRLPDSQSKEQFITAICEKQFFGIEPNLSGIEEFAYASQKHSLDKSRMGWEDVQKREVIVLPSIVPSEGPSEGPSAQEKEKEKDKEKDKIDSIDFVELLNFINLTFGRKFKTISKQIQSKYQARLKDGYTKKDILTAIINCKNNSYHIEKNYQYCTPEFFSRTETLDKYSEVIENPKRLIASHPIIID